MLDAHHGPFIETLLLVNRSVWALFLELLQGFDEPYGACQGAIGNKSFSIYSKFF